MNPEEFLWHAKRGHGECLIEMKQGNILNYKDIVKKVFLNNYAFLAEDEYRSSYAYELVRFYNDDKYFLNLLWSKIKRTKLENYYTFNYLINNLYFLLKRNKNYNYENKVKYLLIKKLNKNIFTTNENNSICSLISLVIDLNTNISIKEIIDQYYTNFHKSNLDLSNIEYYYQISLTNKNNNSNLIHEEDFENFDTLLKCISNNSYFNKQLPNITNNINNKHFELLLDLLDDDKIDNSSKNNILKLVLFSNKRDIKTINKIIKIMDNSTKSQKIIIYEILVKVKSKKILSILFKKNLKDSFIIRLLLNNYSEDQYEKIHNKILKLKINYINSDNWFEVENNLIEYFNKKNIDEKLLIDLKFFFKNGLSSKTRYKTALILKKYNMLNNKEIESLKYDANYKIRQKFKKFQF